MSGLSTGTITGPGSAHCPQALQDGAGVGGHGQHSGPPSARLPDAKDRLDLAAPQQGYENPPVHGG